MSKPEIDTAVRIQVLSEEIERLKGEDGTWESNAYLVKRLRERISLHESRAAFIATRDAQMAAKS